MAWARVYPVLIVTLAAFALTRSVSAQPTSQPPTLDGPGSPATAPTTQALPGDGLHYYPDAALKGSREGSATVQCKVVEGGGLTDCIVLSENPTGYRFGAKAVEIARMLKLKERPDGSYAPGGVFRTQMTFKLAP